MDDDTNATISCKKGPGISVPEWVAEDLNWYASGDDAFGEDNATYSNWGYYFLEQANKSHAENKSQGVKSELEKQYNIIQNETQTSYYRYVCHLLTHLRQCSIVPVRVIILHRGHVALDDNNFAWLTNKVTSDL